MQLVTVQERVSVANYVREPFQTPSKTWNRAKKNTYVRCCPITHFLLSQGRLLAACHPRRTLLHASGVAARVQRANRKRKAAKCEKGQATNRATCGQRPIVSGVKRPVNQPFISGKPIVFLTFGSFCDSCMMWTGRVLLRFCRFLQHTHTRRAHSAATTRVLYQWFSEYSSIIYLQSFPPAARC